MINLVSKSLLLFCCCCCSSNEIRMSSKHIKQTRSELNSSIPPSRISYSLCCWYHHWGRGKRKWLGEYSIFCVISLPRERRSVEKPLGKCLTSSFYHFEDPSQGAFAVPCTGLLGFSRLWLLVALAETEKRNQCVKRVVEIFDRGLRLGWPFYRESPGFIFNSAAGSENFKQ